MISATFRRFAKCLSTLAKDTKAAIMPILALAMIPLVVMVGSGIDYGRAISEREILSNALDVAALNIASQLSSSFMSDAQIKVALEAAFEANISSLSYKEDALEHLTFNVDPDAGVVTVRSQIDVPSYFIHIGGIGPESIPMAVETEVNYSRFDVELALVVDVTGSMGGDMGTLRTASAGVVNTLIPEGTSPNDSKVRISLVPYSQGVNLGEYADAVTNGQSSWRNCVSERVGDEIYTDAPYDADTGSPGSYFSGASTGCSSSSVMEPLTADRDILIPAIEDLRSIGYTAGQTGTAWGWYSLSPNFSNLWPAESVGESYTNEDVLKFAIIMTDGDNNRFYDYDYTTESCSRRWSWSKGWYDDCRTNVCSGWCEISANENDFNNEASVRARGICEGMKDAGITIYGIYFGSDNNSPGARNMKACATNESTTYYQATSSSQLINAFGNIAKKIQAIYLAK
ncbi:pilus assembly protein [Roseibium sp. CAU 1637]|uniref:Pilus assembly protein n=1 Tax=Roseibium limicola TaxID=2816037 RepID=A0A939ET39_9HYPH|nr:TadE/TadG family type IV pilus assembly protein [Roseibium limicola]MBO0347133.1 pilus assembly protein [Roseibium limicola]